ncbi:MAG: hypothetical protein JXD19_04975 [Deltaproteobacteria bacterium]|nr:hypothetical protein [Deltaproteobacteria bacterium]
MRYVVVVLLLLMNACTEPDKVVVSSSQGSMSREELREAMLYHGIIFAEQDRDGEWYFVRDGRRVRLFAYAAGQKK